MFFFCELPGCWSYLQVPPARGRAQGPGLSAWYSLSPSFSPTPHWLILFWLAWAGMHFHVQAVWQWRVPSFCSINISFSIWMQIWDVTLRIQMGCLSCDNEIKNEITTYQKLLPVMNALGSREGGSCIILPFMCETGGLPEPCVYVLLSLTWCNGTCCNNSGRMASRQESVCFFSSEYYWSVNGQSAPSPHHRNQISSFLPAWTIEKTHLLLLLWGLSTLACNKRPCFIVFGCISGHILQNLPHLFLLPRMCSLSETTSAKKAPKMLPFKCTTNNGALQPHRWMSLDLSASSLSLCLYRKVGHSSWLQVLISPGLFGMSVHKVGRGLWAGVAERSKLFCWQRWDRREQHPLISESIS